MRWCSCHAACGAGQCTPLQAPTVAIQGSAHSNKRSNGGADDHLQFRERAAYAKDLTIYEQQHVVY